MASARAHVNRLSFMIMSFNGDSVNEINEIDGNRDLNVTGSVMSGTVTTRMVHVSCTRASTAAHKVKVLRVLQDKE